MISRESPVVVVRLSVCSSPSIRRTKSHTQQTSEERERKEDRGPKGQKAEIDRDDATHRREREEEDEVQRSSRDEDLLKRSLIPSPFLRKSIADRLKLAATGKRHTKKEHRVSQQYHISKKFTRQQIKQRTNN